MRAYRQGTPAYFATPPTNLIYALHQSLSDIVPAGIDPQVALEARWTAHAQVSDRIKAHVVALGLTQLVDGDGKPDGAHGMTAIRFPPGIKGAQLLTELAQRGVVAGTGLHPSCKTQYFRLGHMGVSVTDPVRGDTDRLLRALDEALAVLGWIPAKQALLLASSSASSASSSAVSSGPHQAHQAKL